jgi:hypothetical protein
LIEDIVQKKNITFVLTDLTIKYSKNEIKIFISKFGDVAGGKCRLR